MPQRQVLRPRRGADGIRLHEAKRIDGLFERDGAAQPVDGVTAEIVERTQG
jgi:hypothetical protein